MAKIQKYKTPNGLYRWRVRWSEDGKQKSHSEVSYTAAHDYLINLEHSLKTGAYVSPDKICVRVFLDDWFSVHKKKLEYNTITGYELNIRHIKSKIGDIPLQSLKAADIEKMFSEIMLSGKSKQYIFTTLNLALRYAVKNRLIPFNLCDMVDKPKRKKYQAAFIKPAMVSAYLKLFEDSWLYPGVVLSLFCGLRRGELLALQWKDVDFKTMKININHSVVIIKNELILKKPKSNQIRAVSMPLGVAVILKKYRQQQNKNKLLMGPDEYISSDFVIREDNGTRPRPDYISRYFNRRIKSSNLPHVRFHDLRHSAASLMLVEGVGLKVVSEILGHSSISITGDLYSHVIEEQKKDAANKLGKYLY